MTRRPDHAPHPTDPSVEPVAEAAAAEAILPGDVPGRGAHEAPRIRPPRPGDDDAERRRKPAPRRRGRVGQGRRDEDRIAAPADARRQPRPERRRVRTLSEQRAQWAEVRRWVAHRELEPFRVLLERLAQVAFGPAATVMPHLRRSRGRNYLAFVVDAACPEAGTNYAAFLPLERAFWTAYATLPKPASAFMVAVRPARGWCRSEALMPLFAQFSAPETMA